MNQRLSESLPTLHGVLALLLLDFQILPHLLAQVLHLSPIERHLALQFADQVLSLHCGLVFNLPQVLRPFFLSLDVSALQSLVVIHITVLLNHISLELRNYLLLLKVEAILDQSLNGVHAYG